MIHNERLMSYAEKGVPSDWLPATCAMVLRMSAPGDFLLTKLVSFYEPNEVLAMPSRAVYYLV